jgi:hypothetical protein
VIWLYHVSIEKYEHLVSILYFFTPHRLTAIRVIGARCSVFARRRHRSAHLSHVGRQDIARDWTVTCPICDLLLVALSIYSFHNVCCFLLSFLSGLFPIAFKFSFSVSSSLCSLSPLFLICVCSASRADTTFRASTRFKSS